MFSFVKSLVFGKEGNDKRGALSEANRYFEEAFSDSDEDMPEESVPKNQTIVKAKDNFDINELIGDERDEEEDLWNNEWNAVEEVITGDNKKYLEVDPKNCNLKGVVTKMVGDNELVIDDIHKIKYKNCCITDLCVGDLVTVETNHMKEVSVKPLRYKVFTAKITDYENSHQRFIFSKHAFIRKTSSTQNYRVGDVLKCVVIETRTNRYNWRAYPYKPYCDPTTHTEDKIQSYTNELMENKNGIEIIREINFGEIRINTKKTILVWIKNKSQRPQTLLSVDNEEGENQIHFKSFHKYYGKPIDPPYTLAPNDESYVELSCDSMYCGDHNELVVFKFEGFKIGRYVSVTVLDNNSENQSNARESSCDSTHYRRRHFGADTWIIPGEKLFQQNKHIFDKLEKYTVPNKLWQTLENNWPLDDIFPELSQPLDKINYRKRFHALLYLEEVENQNNVRKHDMKDVTLKRDGRFIAITVPGLADGRPSLIMGDKVVAFCEKKPTDTKTLGFEGFIHDIRRDEILVRFNEELHRDFRDYSGGLFKVVFQTGRMVFRRCHHAIDLAPHMVEQVLFPTQVLIKAPLKKIPIDSISWYNTSLNIQQKLAVIGAIRGECRPTPYIIFGPPGTGKTVTIVESILQVFRQLPHSRIIACTAANSSADLIAQKLLESKLVSDQDLIRVTALHRINSVPEAVQSVTQIADEDPKKWLYHRILVTTTSQAGVVFRHRISASHFTHVFIDEAAQVMEPESLIPISMSVIGHGVVVLAGDHKQLGPVVQCIKAKKCRLERSLMERLMTCFELYGRDEKFKKFGYYNPKFVVKLVNNYRSDEQIMKIPSKLFYESELIFNTETDHNLILRLQFNSGVNFVGIKGEDRQDPDCPSWYNPQEIIKVCSFLDKLYENGVEPKDIGIITPYRKQVSRIRTHIHDMGLVECKVATIEEFQGLEKRVIILSMVRSVADNLEHDLKYNLGFIHNAKRFNVAISRAMSLIIVVANPQLLSRDRNWSQFIDYCIEKQSYHGVPFRDFTPKMNKPLRRLQNIMG